MKSILSITKNNHGTLIRVMKFYRNTCEYYKREAKRDGKYLEMVG
jgi:hypothetical protein